MKGTIWPRPHVKDLKTGERRPVRGSTWTYQFTVTRNGKRRHFSKGGYRTKRECERGLSDALAADSTGTQIEPSKLTMREYLVDEWLPVQRTSKKPSTYRGYSDIVANRLLPHLGDVLLTKLNAVDVTRTYTALRTSGRRNGAGGISERSLKHTHSVLHSALEHAVETNLIGRNPAARLARDVRPKPRPVEMKTWTAEQLRAFLASVEGDRLRSCFLLAALTGMRRSELLGLRWADIDLDQAVLAVRRGRVAAGYEVSEGEPKSGRARTVALDPETVAELRRHRARQLQERMALGEAWTDSGLVFTREDGTGYHPVSVSDAFNRRVARSGLERIRFHDLRHTHASLMLAAGVHPKVVQERLGHSSISITLDLYSHVAPGMQEEAAARLGGLVFGGRK